MSISIPQPFRGSVVGPVTVAGIPSTYTVGISSIPPVHFAMDSLPTIHVAVDTMPTIPIKLEPVEIRLTEFPSIRAHIPANFAVGFQVMGTELATIRLCGEAQVITEPYRPNPCEVCGPLGKQEPLRPVQELTPVGAARETVTAAKPAAATRSVASAKSVKAAAKRAPAKKAAAKKAVKAPVKKATGKTK